MFESLKVPAITGRRALLVINCQKDVFSSEGAMVPNPADFLDRIRKSIPHYRKAGTDIVWVMTIPKTKEASKQVASAMESDASDTARKPVATNGSPPRKPQRDLALVDELDDLFDPARDVVISKHAYSAFDGTPLLMALRMKMVTTIHLCGGLSNLSILSTAYDAAQHGFDVSVLEDCMGFRNEEQHVQAMKKMADGLCVQGVDSEEIVEEAESNASPDADPYVSLGHGINGISISNDDDQSRQKAARGSPGAGGPHGRHRTRSKWQSEPHSGPIGEGDSALHTNALSIDLAGDAFERLKSEVRWQAMMHRSGEVPRRVAVQGVIGEDDSVPVYRHPADESPPLEEFHETVRQIRDECAKLVGQPFNHVLVQLYRHGQDNISEHSDKTLDITRGSSIVNVSLGAQRTMTLRLKKSALPRTQRPDIAPKGSPSSGAARESQRIPLPHNSVFVLGWNSNARWLHGIRPDKRLEAERSEAEKAYGGERISLTFRSIATFTDIKRTRIWGQGARSKDKSSAGKVLASDSAESERMVIAFGKENQMSDFDWDAEYGSGFDALDLVVVNRPDESVDSVA